MAFKVDVRNVLSGNVITSLQVLPAQRIAELKQALERVSGTPARCQRLSLGDDGEHELNDPEIVADTRLMECSVVCFAALSAKPDDFVEAVRDGTGDMNLLRYFVNSGADINLKADAPGRRPNLDERLLDAMDNIALMNGMKDASALHHAAHHGFLQVCRYLLENDEFTETDAHCTAPELTALHVAVIHSRSDIACMILKSPRFQNIDQEIYWFPQMGGPGCSVMVKTALSMACLRGLPDVVSLLLAHPRCQSLNSLVDDYDTTNLMLAACRHSLGNVRVCRLIMADSRFTKYTTRSCAADHGHVPTSAGDCLGESGTAYDFAVRVGLTELSRELKSLCYPNGCPGDQMSDAPSLDNEDKGPSRQTQTRVPGMPFSPTPQAQDHAQERAMSTLSCGERRFLKAVKHLRDVLKLEEKQVAGTELDSMQSQKLAGKQAALQAARCAEQSLAPASDLREKTADIMPLLDASWAKA